MRIVHFIDSGGLGGIERHVETLCVTQRAAGHEASVLLYADHPSPWPNLLARAGVPVRSAGGPRGCLGRLRASGAHVMHTHGYKAGLIGRLACRALGIPVVSTYHAGERAPFPVSLYQSLDEASARLCPRIAVSAQIAARLPAPVRIINNFVPAAQADLTRPLPARIAFVGRLSHEKGPDLFCDLAARCARPEEDWTIYGDGPLRSALEQGRRAPVTFRGLVTDMQAHWPDIGLLVMTSRAEGLPYAALEALAHGVPVLAHGVGGLPDLLAARPDWLMSAEDPARWAEALDRWRLARRDEPRALRAAAASLLEGAYSPNACLPQIFEVYRAAGAPC